MGQGMFWVSILLFVATVTVVFFWIWLVEYLWCAFIKHQAPCVASSGNLKRETVRVIRQFYPDTKHIIEIGSGHGGLARYVARRTGANVIAVENMPFAAMISKIGDCFCMAKSKTLWVDAFDYLDKTDKKFDVAIAYLGPRLTPKLIKHKNKIKVLITMDFEIGEMVPVRIIDLKRGSVTYNNKKYPHKLFVYEF